MVAKPTDTPRPQKPTASDYLIDGDPLPVVAHNPPGQIGEQPGAARVEPDDYRGKASGIVFGCGLCQVVTAKPVADPGLSKLGSSQVLAGPLPEDQLSWPCDEPKLV